MQIIALYIFHFANMSLELEQGDDDDEDDWCNDVWNIGLPPSREYLQPRSRTLTQIAKLQVKLILDNTEMDPITWVHLYAEKFREIVNNDPSLTEFQIKHLLYYAPYARR